MMVLVLVAARAPVGAEVNDYHQEAMVASSD